MGGKTSSEDPGIGVWVWDADGMIPGQADSEIPNDEKTRAPRFSLGTSYKYYRVLREIFKTYIIEKTRLQRLDEICFMNHGLFQASKACFKARALEDIPVCPFERLN